MANLRILHVIPNLLKGGAQRLVVDICNELRCYNNIQVKLIVFDRKNEFAHMSSHIDIEYCSYTLVPSIFRKDTIDILDYEKVVSDFNPNIIHSHLYLAEIVSRENCRPNTVYFTHGHDNIAQLNSFEMSSLFSKRKLTSLYERKRLMPKYEAANNNFIAISKDTESFFKRVLPNSLKKNVNLILNGINTKAFHANKDRVLRSKVNLVNVGNLLDKKNQIFLFPVVKYMVEKGIDVHLKLIGDGANRSFIASEIERLQLSDYIQLVGAVDNVQQYLWGSDVYVHSALYEPFGLVLIEAMAAGLPVVCLNGKGNVDIIESGKNGYLVNQIDAEFFAERVIQVINNQVVYSEMSAYAKKFAEQFDISLYVDKLLTLYTEKLNQKKVCYTKKQNG